MTATFTPRHHPDCETLLRFAAGKLSPGMQLIVAAHLDLCPACRHELQAYEAEAGLALEALPPEDMENGCLENLLHKIDENGPATCIDVTIPIQGCAIAQHTIPAVLATYAGAKGEHVRWDYSLGVAAWVLPLAHGGAHVPQAQLLCLDAGQRLMPSLFDNKARILILSGALHGMPQSILAGDLVEAVILRTREPTAEKATLCLVVKPTKEDVPSWVQRLFSVFRGVRA